MRRVCLGISAISTFLFASCPENPANAMTLGGFVLGMAAVQQAFEVSRYKRIAGAYRINVADARWRPIDAISIMDESSARLAERYRGMLGEHRNRLSANELAKFFGVGFHE